MSKNRQVELKEFRRKSFVPDPIHDGYVRITFEATFGDLPDYEFSMTVLESEWNTGKYTEADIRRYMQAYANGTLNDIERS